MNKKQIFSKSLQASKDLVNSLTKEQLEEIMCVFDNYEIEQYDIHSVSKSFYCIASNGYDGFTKDKCKEQCDMCKSGQ